MADLVCSIFVNTPAKGRPLAGLPIGEALELMQSQEGVHQFHDDGLLGVGQLLDVLKALEQRFIGEPAAGVVLGGPIHEEVGGGAECIRQSAQGVGCGHGFAGFIAADVRVMDRGDLGEILLGHFLTLAEVAQALREAVGRCLRHGGGW